MSFLDAEYDRAKVPPHNGNDPRSPLVVSKPFCFQPFFSKVQERERKGYKRGTARNILHSFPLSGTAVVQSHWAWVFLHKKFGMPGGVQPKNLCSEKFMLGIPCAKAEKGQA